MIIVSSELTDYDSEDLGKVDPPLIYTAFANLLNKALSGINIGYETIILEGRILFTGDKEAEYRVDLEAKSNLVELGTWETLVGETAISTNDYSLINMITSAIEKITNREVEFLWEAGNRPTWYNVVDVVGLKLDDIQEFISSDVYFAWVDMLHKKQHQANDIDREIFKVLTGEDMPAMEDHMKIALLIDEDL